MTISISLTNFKRILYGLSAGLIVAVAGVSFALAQENVTDKDINQETLTKIQFPVAELGGCIDKQACKGYCDAPENRRACFDFAKKHGLIKQEKIRKIEKRLTALEKAGGGPGGCKNEQECEAYCSNISKMSECLEFAKIHDVMDKRDLEEAEKIQAALARGAKLPGGCASKSSCEAYCENPDNMDECVAFAEQAGFMDARELEEMKRVLPLMKRGETPGGCRTRTSCEAYCKNPENLGECIVFAEKTGLADSKEIAIMKKTGGKGPGGCRGRFECETYCNEPGNIEECFNFAEEHGLIPPEEIEQIRKIGGPAALKDGGPGGCQGKRECEAYCKNPAHQEECFSFAAEKGLIPPEEIERIKTLGGPGTFVGPGGCVGPRECEEYCLQEEHFVECSAFFSPPQQDHEGFTDGAPPEEFNREHPTRRAPPPFIIPGFAGPGGCKTPQECFEFCKQPDNLETCKQFTPAGSPPDQVDAQPFLPKEGEQFIEFPGQHPPELAPPPFSEEEFPHGGEDFKAPPIFIPPPPVEGGFENKEFPQIEQHLEEEPRTIDGEIHYRVEEETAPKLIEEQIKDLPESLPGDFHIPDVPVDFPEPPGDFHIPEGFSPPAPTDFGQPPTGDFRVPDIPGDFPAPPPESKPVSLLRQTATALLLLGLLGLGLFGL